MTVTVLAIGGILLIGCVAFGYIAWDRVSRRRLVQTVRDQWQNAGRDILFPPVSATFHGDDPHTLHQSDAPETGALGLVNGALVFVTRQDGRERITPFDQIHWVGIRPIMTPKYERSAREQALIVHHERGGRWRIGAWIMQPDRMRALAQALSEQIGQAELHILAGREDFGPESALHLEQDVYGQWHPAMQAMAVSESLDPPGPTWQSAQGDLYLAPDRLLFDYVNPIPLDQVRRVDVYEKGGPLHELNPFHEDLLRIEYHTPDGEHHVTGFEVRYAQRWGELIAERTHIPFQTHEGRKKKAG